MCQLYLNALVSTAQAQNEAKSFSVHSMTLIAVLPGSLTREEAFTDNVVNWTIDLTH